jgi:glycosyltransferase involved in cell wall biosynthesis
MRILVLTHEFPPVGGGGGHAALDTGQGFVKRGHEVHLLTAHMKGLPRKEIVDGIQVTRFSSFRRLPFKADLLAMIGFIIAGFWVGLRHINAWRPDIIHVHFAVPGGPLAWLLSKLYNVPYVITAHLGDIPGGVPQKTSQWFRWVYPFTPPIWNDAVKVVAVSEYSRNLAQKCYPVDIKVVPNGVDLTVLDPGIIQVNNPPKITFAGRLMPQKNPVTLIRVMAQLCDLDWNFIMLGDGPLQAEVEQEIAKADMQDRFKLTGWVTPDDVTTSFRKSDILFMPSLSEGLPIVGVQALSMGLAIVGSRVGGFVEIVEQGQNGYLFSPENSDAMHLELRKLISDPEKLLTFRKTSRELAERFGINRVVDDYIKIFRNYSGYGC